MRSGGPTSGIGNTITKLGSVGSRRGANAPEQRSMCTNLLMHTRCTTDVARTSPLKLLTRSVHVTSALTTTHRACAQEAVPTHGQYSCGCSVVRCGRHRAVTGFRYFVSCLCWCKTDTLRELRLPGYCNLVVVFFEKF